MSLKILLQAAYFAAEKHKTQRRKGADASPYINHPLHVADLLANIGNINDTDVLIAAILHDTIEDTETTAEEITELFNASVCGYVLEVTDDRTLSQAERKQAQIDHAPHLSNGAKLIKLCDKISNITDVIKNPPHEWSVERRRDYIDWGIAVVNGMRGVNSALEEHFDNLTSAGLAKLA